MLPTQINRPPPRYSGIKPPPAKGPELAAPKHEPSALDGGLFSPLSAYARIASDARAEQARIREQMEATGYRPSALATALKLAGAGVGLAGALSGRANAAFLGLGLGQGAQASEQRRMTLADATMDELRRRYQAQADRLMQAEMKRLGLESDLMLQQKRAQADEDLVTLREELYGKRPDVQARVKNTNADTEKTAAEMGLVEARTALAGEQALTERELRPLEARTERKQGDAAGALTTQRLRVKDPEAVIDFAGQKLSDGSWGEAQARRYLEDAGLSPDLLPAPKASTPPPATMGPATVAPATGGFVRPDGGTVPFTLDLRQQLQQMQQGLIDGTTTEDEVERVLRALGLDPDALE